MTNRIDGGRRRSKEADTRHAALGTPRLCARCVCAVVRLALITDRGYTPLDSFSWTLLEAALTYVGKVPT